MLSRINDELQAIWESSVKINDNIASYYLTAKALVDMMWDDANSLVGDARGSVAAFYTGYDSNNNKVDISQTGVCTFLYDAENNAVYVLNTNAGVQDFVNNGYSASIDKYGLNIPQGDNHSGEVILVKFDGRYFKYEKYLDAPNYSKGTFEEPVLTLAWKPAGSLLS